MTQPNPTEVADSLSYGERDWISGTGPSTRVDDLTTPCPRLLDVDPGPLPPSRRHVTMHRAGSALEPGRKGNAMQPLKPLNPLMHPSYVDVIYPHGADPMPSDIRERVATLTTQRNVCPEHELDMIDRQIVAETWWYALRPDEIARRVLEQHGWAGDLSIKQATILLAAIGESGYPIAGNGAPDHERDHWDDPHPVRGSERDRVIWDAAAHWARMASRRITYVSLGDCRGFAPRAVQYDNPGSMHPCQQAALTLGPAADRDDECDSHGYMRAHTRLLLLVSAEGS